MDKKLVEIETLQYQIADQWVEILLPGKVQAERLLPSFVPFAGTAPKNAPVMCSLLVAHKEETVCEPFRQLIELNGVLGHCFRLLETEKGYIVELQMAKGGEWCWMMCDWNFTVGYVYVDMDDRWLGQILSSFMMVMFGQASVLNRTVLIHASVVEKDGKGYAFMGKSGTGKSTHSALWLCHMEGFELLNDDNPAIRVDTDGKVYIYGTPWSGKTPCYKNHKVQLEALVRLEQAPENKFYQEWGIAAILALLPGCSSMRWNTKLYMALVDDLEIIVHAVLVGHLECLPDKAAALLCYDEIKNLIKKTNQ